jgi:hypothetical protein
MPPEFGHGGTCGDGLPGTKTAMGPAVCGNVGSCIHRPTLPNCAHGPRIPSGNSPPPCAPPRRLPRQGCPRGRRSLGLPGPDGAGGEPDPAGSRALRPPGLRAGRAREPIARLAARRLRHLRCASCEPRDAHSRTASRRA